MHSFFCNTLGKTGEPVELAKRESDHLFKTLRAAPGDTVELLDGRGGRALATVQPGRVLLTVSREQVPEPETGLLLYTAVPRKAKFDTLLKQAAELGVREIRLLLCERSVAAPEGSDRWETLLQEGCKQSGNPFLPKIAPPVKLAAALAEFSGTGYFGAVENPGAEAPRPAAGNVAWFVGPEGGFTAAEEEAMARANIHALNLGPYVLRLETAAVCGLAVLRRMITEAGR